MLFGRKNPASWGETLRVWLWPRRSWARSAKYVSKRILRLTASPHAISAGVAAGVFASFTPLLGFHFLLAFMVAYLIAGNFLSAALGTFFGNPITFPFIWTFTYKLGTFILSGHADDSDAATLSSVEDVSLMDLGFSGVLELVGGIWHPLLKPMLVGAFPLGVLFGMMAYVVTRWAAVAFRRHRTQRLAKKNSKLRAPE